MKNPRLQEKEPVSGDVLCIFTNRFVRYDDIFFRDTRLSVVICYNNADGSLIGVDTLKERADEL